jgi:hypothetical protein
LQSDWNEREREREKERERTTCLLLLLLLLRSSPPKQTELETKASLAAAPVDD